MDAQKLEQQIIALYDTNLVNCFSINQIAKLLKKTYPFINKKVSSLLEHHILNKIVVGKSHLCSLNFENEQTILLLSIHELFKKQKLKGYERVESFVETHRLNITVHSIIESKGKINFVVENLKDRREIQREFPTAEVVDRKEFLDLLLDDSTLFADHVVLYGSERFFELVRMALPELKRLHSPLQY